nr:poxvirus poly(A) polymerase N-terminal domain [Cressdnaviricota sp.]
MNQSEKNQSVMNLILFNFVIIELQCLIVDYVNDKMNGCLCPFNKYVFSDTCCVNVINK